jgi:hypothetical protein
VSRPSSGCTGATTCAALDAELAGDLGVVRFRMSATPCVDRRLQEIRTGPYLSRTPTNPSAVDGIYCLTYAILL